MDPDLHFERVPRFSRGNSPGRMNWCDGLLRVVFVCLKGAGWRWVMDPCNCHEAVGFKYLSRPFRLRLRWFDVFFLCADLSQHRKVLKRSPALESSLRAIRGASSITQTRQRECAGLGTAQAQIN